MSKICHEVVQANQRDADSFGDKSTVRTPGSTGRGLLR